MDVEAAHKAIEPTLQRHCLSKGQKERAINWILFHIGLQCSAQIYEMKIAIETL